MNIDVEKQILVADIGGTNSRFAIFSYPDLHMEYSCSVPSMAADFGEVIRKAQKISPRIFQKTADVCVAAIAGPVRCKHKVHVTNLPYVINITDFSQFARRTILINDFEAQIRACLTPSLYTATCISKGSASSYTFSPKCLNKGVDVIGAGTGLGAAYCRTTANHPIYIMQSEAGHCLFPFLQGKEQEIYSFLQNSMHTEIEAEHILSGKGLSLLHEFITGKTLSPSEITTHPDFWKSETCSLFARFYGRVCREFALTTLPLGGIVITGGLAEKAPSLVTHNNFIEEFLKVRPTLKEILKDIPIWFNTNPGSGLWGAAQAALNFF